MAKQWIEKTAIILTAAGLLVLLGFTGNSNLQKPSQSLSIHVACAGDNYFISQSVVRQKIISHMDTLEGRVITRDKLKEIYELVTDIPWVENARVYRTINANVNVEVILREPMMRVINRRNNSFYVDHAGYLFPLSEEHTARVMLATGHIHASPEEMDNLLYARSNGENKADERLEGLFRLASFIRGDAFWSAFIDHIYVRSDGQYELTPKDGAHIIEFGDATDIEHKFHKLKLFYTGGITQVGWHYYRRVNIAYKNQVICSK